MNRTFIESKEFTKRWAILGFSDEDLRVLQNRIMKNLTYGAMMEGTGGLRKLRIPFAGHGKSGGARVCYADFEVYEVVHLITVFPKNEKENLTREERDVIRQLLNRVAKEMERNRK